MRTNIQKNSICQYEDLLTIVKNISECADKILCNCNEDELIKHVNIYKSYLHQFSQIIETIKNDLTDREIDLIKKISDINSSLQGKLQEEKGDILSKILNKIKKKKVLKSYNPYFRDNKFSKNI